MDAINDEYIVVNLQHLQKINMLARTYSSFILANMTRMTNA